MNFNISYLFILIIPLFIAGIIFLYMQNKEEGPYYSYKDYPDLKKENPYQGKKEDYYYMLEKSGLVDSVSLIHYYLLKWSQEGAISEKDVVFIKKPDFRSNYEKKFFSIIVERDPSTMKKEEGRTRREVSFLKQEVRQDSVGKLINQGLVKAKNRSFQNENFESLSYTEAGLEHQKDFIGYRNYLNEKEFLNKEEILWSAYFRLDPSTQQLGGDGKKRKRYVWTREVANYYGNESRI